jgi:hypothetical protein
MKVRDNSSISDVDSEMQEFRRTCEGCIDGGCMERDIGVDDEVLPDDELRLVVLGVLVEDDTGECG